MSPRYTGWFCGSAAKASALARVWKWARKLPSRRLHSSLNLSPPPQSRAAGPSGLSSAVLRSRFPACPPDEVPPSFARRRPLRDSSLGLECTDSSTACPPQDRLSVTTPFFDNWDRFSSCDSHFPQQAAVSLRQ